MTMTTKPAAPNRTGIPPADAAAKALGALHHGGNRAATGRPGDTRGDHPATASSDPAAKARHGAQVMRGSRVVEHRLCMAAVRGGRR